MSMLIYAIIGGIGDNIAIPASSVAPRRYSGAQMLKCQAGDHSRILFRKPLCFNGIAARQAVALGR